MVGFTANAKVLVDKLAKYLKLSDIFIDMRLINNGGGGKEVAIKYLIDELESKEIPIPKGRMIFVGDSLRGDIGTSLTAREKNEGILGREFWCWKDRDALLEIERQINTDPKLRQIADNIDVPRLVIGDVPLDEKGKSDVAFQV